MKYKKYQSLNEEGIIKGALNKLAGKVGNAGNKIISNSQDKLNQKAGDVIDKIKSNNSIPEEKYFAYRKLLDTGALNDAQQGEVLNNIYQLFINSFTYGWDDKTRSKCENVFNRITKSVQPAGRRININQSFGNVGLRQLQFWVALIEAYRWDEITKPDNDFKNVIKYLLKRA